MKKQKSTNPNRRQFITKIVPACAMTCLGAKHLLGMQQTQTEEEAKHKFDQPMERQMTYRQYFKRTTRGKIDLIKTMVKELGEEKAIEIIQTNTREGALAMGKRQAKAAKKNDLNTYVDMFRDKDQVQQDFSRLQFLPNFWGNLSPNFQLRLSCMAIPGLFQD